MPESPIPDLKPAIALAAMLATLTLAACGATTGTTSGTTTATTSQPMPVARTSEQIRGDCWMKYEGDTKMNIDKRAALVDACIAERSRTGAPIN